jgi:chromosome segregation protein
LVNELQLKRLEAYGFKSFADRIDIEFNNGITAIVGPNGSGKSNITDAIRWVLGEQNVRNLRGTKAEDIIFTGSNARRALGVAEVSLTFDNSDGKLGVDFKEVVVTRRLFRSGESEFYINKAKCRLKDVYNIFADTGLGHDGMSVISQNKIDEILNSKPEERRLFFEETAGITKYRNRKRESVRKLDDTQKNLVRVNDIIQEIENQLEPLAENAERTKQYNILQESYKKCKLTQLLHKYDKCNRDADDGQKKIQEIKDEEVAAATAVQLTEAKKEQLNKELLDVEESLKLLADKNNELREKNEENNATIAILNERINQGNMAKNRFQENQKKCMVDRAVAAEQLEKLQIEQISYEEKLTAADDQRDKAQLKAEALAKKVAAQSAICTERLQISQQEENELAMCKNELLIMERDIDENERTASVQQKSYDALQADMHAMIEEKKAIEEQLQKNQKEVQAILTEKLDLKSAVQKASAGCGCLEQEKQELQQKVSSAESKIHFLANMQKEYEGFGRGAKAVLKNKEAYDGGICGAVAELLQVPKEYVTAIEVALGGNLQNIVTEDAEVAKKAINFLKREHLGRVTFLPLSTIMVHRPSPNGEQASAGFIGYASDLVSFDTKYKKVAEFLLARTLVVDTIDHALQLAERQGYRNRIVTLEGELMNPGGSLSGGSAMRKEASFLNRNGEMEILQKQIEIGQKKLNELLIAWNRSREEKERLTKIMEEKADALQSLAVQSAQQKTQFDGVVAALYQQTKQIESNQRQQWERKTSFAKIQEKRMLLHKKIREMEADGKKNKNAYDESLEMLDDLRQDASDLAKFIVDLQIKCTISEQEVLRNRDQCENVIRELQRCTEELERSRQECLELEKSLQNAQIKLIECKEKDQKLQEIRAVGTKDQDTFYQIKMAKLVEIQKNDKLSKQATHSLTEIQNKLHQLELLQTQLFFELKSCVEALQEEYMLSVETAQAFRLDLTEIALKERSRTLENEIAALGPVNPNAIEEYDVLSKRYEFMKKQSDDLIAAKEDLLGIIREMDMTMGRQFSEAFAKIGEYFSDIFVKLFGGGKARVYLTDEKEILTAGVEIEVQLPDKRRQNLAILSGGERALTVIALLFSFLRYKPSPFSVLDEIDAPLDEANISRFGKFLREYAGNTQFIIVTHRKGTMESADCMYGVTIEDAGVSKIVSVRLEDEIN